MGNSATPTEATVQPESRESARVTASTLSGTELFERVYKKQSLPQDSRFKRKEDGGVFTYFQLDKLLRRKENLLYSVVSEGDLIVGLAELEKSPDENHLYWMTFLSVDPKFQGRGYSARLIEEMFRFAEANGMNLEISRFTEQGEQRIRRGIEERAKTSSIRVTYSAPPTARR